MDYQATRNYLLSLPDATEDYPFGPGILVPKIKGKMFALLAPDRPLSRINLKCDPVHAQELRSIFPAVSAGYHMNKKHWNTVLLDGSIPDGELERMIDHSYALVVRGLPTKVRKALELSHGEARLYRA
jgi:predicted DNA-binding protein (MmcQ/YjbR family)